MFNLLFLWFGALTRVFHSRRSLALENLALRQQLAVLKRRRPRPMLGRFDKLFWVIAYRFWSAWKEASRAKTDSERSSRVDLPNGGRESDLGCASHSRRAAHARFRHLRTNDLPLDEARTARPWANQAVASVSAKSPGSDRCNGLLYGPDDHLRRHLLFLRNRS